MYRIYSSGSWKWYFKFFIWWEWRWHVQLQQASWCIDSSIYCIKRDRYLSWSQWNCCGASCKTEKWLQFCWKIQNLCNYYNIILYRYNFQISHIVVQSKINPQDVLSSHNSGLEIMDDQTPVNMSGQVLYIFDQPLMIFGLSKII